MAGYAGYIPGEKAENLYGQTYGKITYTSAAGNFHRGIDQPANVKFNTQMKSEFVQHDARKHDTIAKIVGVQRGEDCYAQVSASPIQTQFHSMFAARPS